MLKNKIIWLALFTMIAFAANSILCRLALKNTLIDPITFTTIRLLSGILVLGMIGITQGKTSLHSGNWLSSLALFFYALFFSLSYVTLPAGLGAILLFGSVQISMISYGLIKKERFNGIQLMGLLMAIVGLGILFLPGVTTPPLLGSLMMLISGLSWGIYSLRGKGSKNPLDDTFGNFLRTAPLIVIVLFINGTKSHFDYHGAIYAVLSGGIASAVGYSVWYIVLPKLKAIFAATIQLTVPIFASLASIVLLDEVITLKLTLASFLVLLGTGVVIVKK